MTLDAYSPTPHLRKEIQKRLEALRRLERELQDRGPTGQGPYVLEPRDDEVKLRAEMYLMSPQRGLGRESPAQSAARFTTALFSSVMLRLRSELGGAGGLTRWESVRPPGHDPNPARRGSRIGGRYRVASAMGHGGLSYVCVAIDEKRQQRVIVKVLRSEAAVFLRESLEVIQGLDHPGILKVLDAGSLGDAYYVVVPLLEGKSLQFLLDVGGSPRGALLLALRRAAAAVAYAHERGVVHRDLKPGNFQVDPDGRVVVLDWDFACRVGQVRESGSPIVGTPLFMAPEQLRGEPSTPRSDVFSLGTILYRILTGSYPAEEGRFVEGIAERILHEVPLPPSFVTDDVPAALDAVAVRALEKDPEKRFANAGELLEALEDV